MIAHGTIELFGEKLPTGDLYLWATDEKGQALPAQRLKALLFAWDSLSFYGTLIETATRGQNSGLLLSPYTAVRFLTAPRMTRLLRIHWSQNLLDWQQAANQYMEALVNGWFVPSFAGWKSGTLAWELRRPDLKDKDVDTHDWFDAVVKDLLLQEEDVSKAFAHLLQVQQTLDPQFGLETSGVGKEWMDEEQWLISIGWKRDDAPFSISIQLVEPTEEESAWVLRLVLRDAADPNFIIETDLTGRPLASSLPAHWQDDAKQRIAKEVDKLRQLVSSLPEGDFAGSEAELDDELAWEFMNHDSSRLLQAGCSVLLPAWWEELRSRKPRLKAKIKSSVGAAQNSLLGFNQLVQFDWKVAVGRLDLSEEEFRRMMAEKKKLMLIRGQWVVLDRDFLNQVMRTIGSASYQKGLSIRDVLEMYWQGLLPELSDDNEQNQSTGLAVSGSDAEPEFLRIEVELNQHLQTIVNQLQEVSSLPLVAPSPDLQAQLRPYQEVGMSWLLFLRQYGFGGCLADDMGLGKTIQFIAYLLRSRQTVTPGPALLICPTSVMGNWEKELERFAPTLRVYVHYGAQRSKGDALLEQVAPYDLVITSYTLAQLDQADLTQVQWDTVCLDEAQNIKNVYTKQRAAIKQLNAFHRIALTGTPIENRLTELWSIFDFLNPGYLGSLGRFTEKYVNPIEKTNDSRLIQQVQLLIRPFLLRRVKKDPAIQLNLPEKQEIKTFVTLTVEQGALYENIVQDLFDKLDTLTGMEKRGLILGALTKLKQICDHPALYLKEDRSTWAGSRSNKLDRLLEMVAEARAEGEQCLIFTQYVEMGHLLQSALTQELSETVSFLHGGVTKAKRDQMVAQFQTAGESNAQKPGILILSLKAGGTGLNLTAANHVFHFDRWWNPAVEDQATDRAFRIGQTRDVQVHKFVTLGTLEERIDEMIERKQNLSRQIVGTSEQWITEMSTQELKDLFSLRKEWVGK